ncbi:ROK family protein [Mariniflexile ostreae]|uniref:ROK family protein n=1 Tax=Mariniflexile ostreae TaxID=1520892 RepID=A0ABV5FBQ7_9FLAO
MEEHVGIGVDLGGTSIKYGLVNTKSDIIWSSKKPTPAKISRDEIVQNICEAILEALQMAKMLNLKVVSVGVGTPGLVKDKNMVLGAADNLADWENVPLGSLIESQVRLPTFIANDADMMATGEFSKFGFVDETLLFFTLGTGIGGALIIKGELFQGHYGMGGELGMFPMIINGEVLNWEDVASTSAMVRLYQEQCDNGLKDKIDGKRIVQLFLEGQPLAVQVVEQVSTYIALGISGYVNALNPSKIIIGGGISSAGEFFIDMIRSKVAEFALKESLENVSIEGAKLGNSAGFVGAAIYSLKHSKY